MSTIEKAIALAAKKYAGQTDKNKLPCIFHPLRLMLKMKSSDQQIVAVLHEILQDSDITVVDLISFGFSQEVIEAIQALTKNKHESLIEVAYRAVKNPIARLVKLADVIDRIDQYRIYRCFSHDFRPLEEYQHIYQILQTQELSTKVKLRPQS